MQIAYQELAKLKKVDGFNNRIDREGNTLLMLAINYAYYSVGGTLSPTGSTTAYHQLPAAFSILVQQGVDINIKNLNGESALSLAKKQGYYPLIQYLLSKDALE